MEPIAMLLILYKQFMLYIIMVIFILACFFVVYPCLFLFVSAIPLCSPVAALP